MTREKVHNIIYGMMKNKTEYRKSEMQEEQKKICFVVRKGMVYFFKIEDKNFTARERSQLSI